MAAALSIGCAHKCGVSDEGQVERKATRRGMLLAEVKWAAPWLSTVRGSGASGVFRGGQGRVLLRVVAQARLGPLSCASLPL